MSKTNIVPISDQPATQEESPNRLSFTLEEMLNEFENGAIPRSKFWQELITALYDTANHVITGVTSVADVKPDNIGNIPLLPKDIDAPAMVRMNGADSNTQQTNQDVFGRSLFYGDACKVVHQYGAYYEVLAGEAYVAGIRFFYPGEQDILIEDDDLPTSIRLDVSWPSDPMMEREAIVEVLVSGGELDDYVDEENVKHFVVKISSIETSIVDDLRIVNAIEKFYLSVNDAKKSDNFGVKKIIIHDRDNAPFKIVDDIESISFFDEAKFQDLSGKWWVIEDENGVKLKWFGAESVSENNMSFDSYPLAEKALNTFGNLVINGGDFYFSERVVVNRDCVISGDSLIYINKGAFLFQGNEREEIDIDEEITNYSETIIKVKTDFSPSDLAFLHSNVNCLSRDPGSNQLGYATGSGGYSWFGEFIIVRENSGSEIKTMTPLVFNNYKIEPMENSGERNRSTIKKINPIKVNIKGIKFKRLNPYSNIIRIKYGNQSTISECEFINNIYSGSSVYYEKCIDCSIKDCCFSLNPNTIMKYGNVNPNAEDYYQFNMVKFVSCQNCILRDSEFTHGSQNADVTYTDSPSINCAFINNRIYYARYNMLTSHSGSIGTVFDGNFGINVWRGISARSRHETIINNTIIGFRGIPYHDDTENVTYALAIVEGYSVNTTVSNNRFDGFERLIWINNYTGRETGLDYFRIYIINNVFGYSDHSLVIYKKLRDDGRKSVQNSLVISNNQFYSYNSTPVLLSSDYINEVEIKSNSFIDIPSDSSEIIKTNGNCIGTKIINNTFPNSNKIAWIKAITDSEIGENTASGSGTQTIGNLITGNMLSDGWIYDNSTISQGGFTSKISNYDFIRIDESSYELDCDTKNTIQTGATVATEITAFKNGKLNQVITIIGNSNINTVTIKETENIRTKARNDVVLQNLDTVRFLRTSNDIWTQL